MNRNINVAVGVSANTTAPTKPAQCARSDARNIPVARSNPRLRRTPAYTNHPAATPINASGTRTDHELSPNSRTDNPITHNAAGGLSTVIQFPASSDPKNHAFHDTDPACAAPE